MAKHMKRNVYTSETSVQSFWNSLRESSDARPHQVRSAGFWCRQVNFARQEPKQFPAKTVLWIQNVALVQLCIDCPFQLSCPIARCYRIPRHVTLCWSLPRYRRREWTPLSVQLCSHRPVQHDWSFRQAGPFCSAENLPAGLAPTKQVWKFGHLQRHLIFPEHNQDHTAMESCTKILLLHDPLIVFRNPGHTLKDHREWIVAQLRFADVQVHHRKTTQELLLNVSCFQKFHESQSCRSSPVNTDGQVMPVIAQRHREHSLHFQLHS